MDAISKFKEAALELQQEKVYLNYEKTVKAYHDDKDLQDKLGEYQLIRLQIESEMQKDEPQRDQEKIYALNKKVNKVYTEATTAPTMLSLNEARAKIEEFVDYVNVILNAAIDGENPLDAQPPEASGCSSDGCSSCAGCK